MSAARERAGVPAIGSAADSGTIQRVENITAAPSAPSLTRVSNNDFAKNLEEFLKERRPGQPFCFWIGTTEPHRPYERDSGIHAGKNSANVIVPHYLPDTDVVRRDLLDYAMEVEWGDSQFGRALAVLEAAGELDRTLVVMTSDHGMPFPRVKGQIYEDGFHLPFAMRWPGHITAGRVVEDFVNARDFARRSWSWPDWRRIRK